MNVKQAGDGERPRPATLVLGLGNPLRGDDGVGPRVVEELLRRELPANVEVVDGGSGGLTLLQTLEGWERAIVVDTAQMERNPGQFTRFTPQQAKLNPRTFSPHYASLAEVLTLATALDRTLPDIVIFGVQPDKIGWGEGLSQAVQKALPVLIDAILEELEVPSQK